MGYRNIFLPVIRIQQLWYFVSHNSYYHALVINYRERLVELSAHLLMIILDYSSPPATTAAVIPAQPDAPPTSGQQEIMPSQEDSVFADDHHPASSAENLFKLYISKLHQKEVNVML